MILLAMGESRVERLFGVGLVEVAQEAHDQAGADAELAPPAVRQAA